MGDLKYPFELPSQGESRREIYISLLQHLWGVDRSTAEALLLIQEHKKEKHQ